MVKTVDTTLLHDENQIFIYLFIYLIIDTDPWSSLHWYKKKFIIYALRLNEVLKYNM